MENAKKRVQAQFGKTAAAYVTSHGHAKGKDLGLLVEVSGATPSDLVLDIATGAGHATLAFAPHVGRVVAVDLTPEMLAQAKLGAGERGLTNIEFRPADAEALPFADGEFDIVICRIAAHHFPDVARAVQEMSRVLKPAGRCLIVDNVVPEEIELDRFINRVELLRDPSHVRACSLSEWQRFFTDAGLSFTVASQWETPIDFEWWVSASQTPPSAVDEIQSMLRSAPPDAVAHFGIEVEPRFGFNLKKAMLIGTK